MLDQQKLFFPIKIGVSRDETDTLVYDNNNCFNFDWMYLQLKG